MSSDVFDSDRFDQARDWSRYHNARAKKWVNPAVVVAIGVVAFLSTVLWPPALVLALVPFGPAVHHIRKADHHIAVMQEELGKMHEIPDEYWRGVGRDDR